MIEKMRKQIGLLALLVLLISFQSLLFARNNQENIHVNIRVIEENTHQITPVMVCITNAQDGAVRLPPSGVIPESPSGIDVFFKGVDFSGDKNWTGPVRKMNGIGNNGDRSFVYKLLPSIPYWSDPVMYQTSGDFTIELHPGNWRISLEHGNEYVPVHEEFVLSEKVKKLTKTIMLKRWINLPHRGWYSGDVHVHHPANKPEFREYLLEYAKAEDVHLVNLLEMGDHHGTEFRQEGFGKEFRTTKDDIILVSGQEDPRSTYGHIIGLNINQLARDTSVYNYYDVVFKKLHEQPGAIAGYSHFSWNGNGVPMGFPLYVRPGEIDFVELLQFAHINTPDYYENLNLGLRLTAAAGSDVPWGSTIGEVRTFVNTGDEFSADKWFEGLKSGHTFVSNGPALFLEIDGNLPGTEIKKSAGSTAELNLKAISNPGIGNINRIAIYHNEGLLFELSNPENQDSLEIKIPLKLTKSEWVAAVVNCDNGAVAHTSPVYIVVDGHPTWQAKSAQTIIYKHLGAIKVMEDMEKSSLFLDQGILKRLEIAREYYSNLLSQINAEQ
jgi:hypothetical protein